MNGSIPNQKQRRITINLFLLIFPATIDAVAYDPVSRSAVPLGVNGIRSGTSKPSSDIIGSLEHLNLRDDEFWRKIPWFNVDKNTFLDYNWQLKNSVAGKKQLLELLSDIAPLDFTKQVSLALIHSPMAVRFTPHVLSLIDWQNPYSDPIRRELIPLASELIQDHPVLQFDSLGEQADSPVEGVAHRYRDKALFLAFNTCPVYCQYCTRSYLIGPDTENHTKTTFNVNPTARWERAFEYIESRPELEDVVISGGDTWNLSPKQLQMIGERLLNMPNIRRIRYATRGPAVMPMRLLTDRKWVDALVAVNELGRRLHKQVCLHTHFNHANAITGITRDALNLLFEKGIIVRNQSVLLRGVNDTPESMCLLVKRPGEINIQPYYVYQCDPVPFTESLRTSLKTNLDIEKHVRGITAGFNCPLHVVDLPGGGGKRDVHSYEYYDPKCGISVFKAPSVKSDKTFMYFDPLHSLDQDMQQAWMDPKCRQAMIGAALKDASLNTH